MGMFIALKINPQACSAGKGCAKCVSVCPVDIFQTGDREILVNIENEDEFINSRVQSVIDLIMNGMLKRN